MFPQEPPAGLLPLTDVGRMHGCGDSASSNVAERSAARKVNASPAKVCKGEGIVPLEGGEDYEDVPSEKSCGLEGGSRSACG